MTDFWKKSKRNICLVFLIAGAASIPLGMETCALDVRQKLVSALVNLLTAGIAAFCYGRMFESRNIGLAGSLLYTWCPYRLSDLYIQGNLKEGIAWSVFPFVILGLVQTYRIPAEARSADDAAEQAESGKRTMQKNHAWVTLTIGFGLLAAFSPAFFLVAVGGAAVTFLVMGKKSLRKETLVCVGKTILATAIISAVVLFPFLMQMRDASFVGEQIPENFRMMGMYLIQYLSIFPTDGSGLGVAATGAVGLQSMGVGVAVVALVFLYLWNLFVRKIPRDGSGRVLCIVSILMILSSNLFPWDLLQNKNMLFSILLAWMQSPAKWGVAACGGLIWIACYMLKRLPVGSFLREFDVRKANLEKADSREAGSWKKAPGKLVLFWLPVLALLASLPMLVDYVIVGEELFAYLDKMSTFLNGLGSNTSLLYRLFVIGINSITAVIAYLSFSKALESRYEGLLGAVIYVLLPARIRLLYTVADVKAYTIMAFLPLAAWALCRICRSGMKGKERLFIAPFILAAAFVTGYGCMGIDVVSAAITLLVCVLFFLGCYRSGSTEGANGIVKGRATLVSAGILAFIYGTWMLNDILMNGWEIFR